MVTASFVALFQERVISAQIHGGHVHLGRLQQPCGFPQEGSHGLLTQQPTLVEQLPQCLFDTAFAFLASQV